MEQLPSEFEGSRICYYDRRASVGQKIFKAISCQDNLIGDLNGNDCDYSSGCLYKKIAHGTKLVSLYMMVNLTIVKKEVFWKALLVNGVIMSAPKIILDEK